MFIRLTMCTAATTGISTTNDSDWSSRHHVSRAPITCKFLLPILHKVYNTCVETYPFNSIIPHAAYVFLDSVVQDLFILPPTGMQAT